MIAEDWITSKCAQERNIMIRRAQSARIIITCAYCIMGVAILLFVLILPGFGISVRLTTNFTNSGKKLPLQTYHICDTTKSPQYELTYITQAIYVFFAIISYTGIDNFLGLVIFHICGQLDILKNRLARLNKNMNMNFHKALKNCVEQHIRLLRFFDF
ncbi:PREDICTED: uncharacterized protein LOC106742801 [Dinoponera quadriceps]|uniref:Uncharacterized protein LOC106742801 n=1 Tax=Dinoponera quadriceps TaxID=609295 RepID=A0A6P3WZP1_DINQU|nr:PREDICTED: uncharacterized protein LOC106742801 [Dinoponera quadriceps]